MDRNLIFGIIWCLFGAIWLFRAYRGTKLEQHLVSLENPTPRRMVRNERRTAIFLGVANIVLGIAHFVLLARR